MNDLRSISHPTLLLLVALSGCASDDDTGHARQSTTCKTSSDCTAQQTCSAGTCVTVGAAAIIPKPASVPPPTPTAEVCNNGKDDDLNGLIDCADPACQREPACYAKPGCNGTACPCDVVAQNCAAPGDRCFPHGEQAAQGQCYPAGQGKLGDPCAEPPLGVPESCGKGLLCVGDSKALKGTCLAICGGTATCGAAHECRGLDFGTGLKTNFGVCVLKPAPPPPPPCNPVGQTGCSSNAMCVPRAQGQPAECAPVGSGAAGSSCGANSECKPALACVTPVGYSPAKIWFGWGSAIRGGTCEPLCAPGVKNTCPSGQSCAPLLDGVLGERKDIGICATP